MNVMAVSVILFGAVQNVLSVGVRVKGPLGGNTTVHCSYPKGSENEPKFFNKGKPNIELVKLDGGVMCAQDSRFSLEDDKDNRKFIVTIRNLSVEDAGLYWCRLQSQPFLTEVNLDVVRDAISDDAFVSQTTSSATETNTTEPQEPQDQQTYIRDKSVHFGVSLGTVILMCGTVSIIFIIMKNKAKAASTQSGKYTEPNVDICVHYKVIPRDSTSVLTIGTPDSIICATPTPSQNQTRSPPSRCEPWGRSRETRFQHPETVVYSAIPQSQPFPQSQSYTPLSTSTQSISLHYSELYFEQRPCVVSDTSAFSEEPHDVYATVHRN